MLDNFHWLSELVDAMNDLGWDVYSFDHEDGIGQVEIDFAYADARTMSDRFVFLRMMANAIARKHGAYASFMPKPFGERTGSETPACHLPERGQREKDLGTAVLGYRTHDDSSEDLCRCAHSGL